MLNDVMKALTTRKPISLTTTSMCSGPFAARIARSQKLHVLRVAAIANEQWTSVDNAVAGGLFKTYGLDVQVTIVPNAAAAIEALTGGVADVAMTDTLTAIRNHGSASAVQFVAAGAGVNDGYVALTAALDAKQYAMSRFARALRANGFADYVDAHALQARIDRLAAEKLIGAPFPASEAIGRVAVISGTR